MLKDPVVGNLYTMSEVITSSYREPLKSQLAGTILELISLRQASYNAQFYCHYSEFYSWNGGDLYLSLDQVREL